MTAPEHVVAACPVCGSIDVLRLVPDWRRIVEERGAPVPVVGCGNPWHYCLDETVELVVELVS